LYGVDIGLGTPNFVSRFFIIMFTLALPFIKISSTMLFPTYTWITTIWLSTFIATMSNSKCVSTIMATICSDIYLVIILGFFCFRFCHTHTHTHIYIYNLVLFLVIDLTLMYK
jgi:hypothetical protein